MKKSILWLAVILWLGTVILVGCDNATTESYDLTNEIWRQLHCYDQFKIEKPANNYWADWLPEVIDWNTVFVEATAKADEEEFRLICTYMDNGEDWNVEVYPLAEINSEEPEVWIANPASVYCEENGGTLKLEDGSGLCMFEDGSYCEEWSYQRWECQPGEIIYNTISDGESNNEELPVAKMRISDDLTQEEIENQINETCGNMWWTWEEGSCQLEDGSSIQF